MAQRKKSKRNAGRHPTRPNSRARRAPRRRRDEPDLLDDVAHALDDPSPLALIGLASSMLTALDPRPANPLARGDDAPPVDRAEFLRSLMEVPTREASALLAAMVGLGDDALLQARVRRELAGRPFDLPRWLARLDATVATRVVEMADVLGDGENVMIGATLPDGSGLTVVVYLDHNAGGIVKDAFVLDESIEDAVATMSRVSGTSDDVRLRDLDPAVARVRVVEAIKFGAITVPPFESDTWPACRPVVEWLCARLPDGATVPERREWTDADYAELTERFLASPHGHGFDDADHRGLMDSLLWYGTGYGNGDPLRWSPTRIEILLVDWLPRKIVADVDYLAKAPGVLRAFVRFAHAESGIRDGLTADALAAVDEFEPEYQSLIRSPRPQGPMALLAAMGALDPDRFGDDDLDDLWAQLRLKRLHAAVGGPDALAALDVAPLPDEDFDWQGVPDDVRDTVGAVLTIIDATVGDLLGVEYRCACRRLLRSVCVRDVTPLRRAARTDISAAAVCWIIAKANGLFDAGPDQWLVKDLLARFGVSGSVSQRARVLLRAGGFAEDTDELDLGTPDLLVSARRRELIRLRDRETNPF